MLVVGDKVANVKRLLVVHLPVDSSNDLMFMVRIRDPVNIASTWIARDRNQLQIIERDGIQRGLGNLIVDERCAQRLGHVVVAICRRDLCEITFKSRGSWNERNVGRWRNRFKGALIATEEEQFVLDDRSTQCAAKLIALQRVADRSKEIPRIEFVIAQELETGSMKFVASGFRDRIDDTSGLRSVVRRQGARFNLELPHRIRERKRQTDV